MPTDKEFLSLEEVADKLGVTYQLISSPDGGGVCDACGERYASRASLRHVCTEDGCEALICNDCWTRRKVRFCKAHQPK